MSIDLAGPVETASLPKDLDLRVFEPATDARAVHTAFDEAFAEEFRARREAHEDWEQRLLKRPDFDPGLWFVAWDGPQVAGVVAAYDFGDIGWVQGLGVRAPWRGRGVGLALLTRAFAALYARDRPTVGLGVDSENETGAGRLYERAGMHVDQRWIFYRRKLEPA
jgi:ribosomal protein S18 acetylase RimI-like enzyme